jgi:gliding motility-associated-like protein
MRPIQIIISTLCLIYTYNNLYSQTCTGTQRVDASYELDRNDVCEGIEITAKNTSQEFGNTNAFYVWDWGDGTKDTTLDLTNVKHTYFFPEQTACDQGIKVPDLKLEAVVPGCPLFGHRVTKPVYVYLKPIAKFDTKALLCAPDTVAMFKNLSCTADTGAVYAWDFGDPASGAANTSTEFEPKHTFSKPGIYVVTLSVQSNCGSSTFSKIVEIKKLPVAAATVNSATGSSCVPVIINLSNQSTGANTFRWTVASIGNGVQFVDSTSELSLNPRLLFTKAGSYVVKLETGNECGTTSWEQTITVADAPTVMWEEPPVSCERLSYTPKITYGGTISSYNWTFEGGTPATSTEANPMNVAFNTPGRYNVTLTVNGACGSQQFIKTVEVIRKENITIAPVAPLCNTSDTVRLNASVPGGTWSGNGVNPQGLFNPASAMVGTNTIQYRYGPDNCRSEAAVDITVRAGTPLNVGQDSTLCQGSPDLTLPFSPTGGSWRGTGITDATLGVFSPVQAGVGEHTLTYTYTEAMNSCVSTATKKIRIEPIPTVNIVENTLPLCNTPNNINLASVVQLQLNPGGGKGIWRGMGIVDTAQGIFNNNNLAVGNYPIVYTYTSPAGCVSQDSFVVQIVPKQQAVAQGDTSVCISLGSLTLQAGPAGGQWSDAKSSINATSGVIDLARAGGGTNTYAYTIFAGTTCESRDEVQVEIIDVSGVNAGPDVAFCESAGQVTLTGFSPAGGRWRGTGVVDSIQGVVDIRFLQPGNYTLTYYIENQLVSSCSAQDQLVLTVNPLPVIGFNTGGKQCVGDTVRFTNTSTNASSYNWNFGNGQTATTENPTVSYATAGDYNLDLTVKSAFACESDTTVVIHVSEPPPTVAFDLDQKTGCADLTVTFLNRSRGEDVDFVWNFGNGRTDSISSPLPVTFLGGLEDTTYFVQLAAKNTCGENRFTDSVRVLSRPTANFGAQFSKYCSGEAVEIRNASFGKPTSFSWDFGNGLTSRDSIPTTQYYFTDTEPDTFQITLIASNACATDTATQLLAINPATVDAFFNLDATEFCAGDTVRIRNLATPGAAITYAFGDSTTSANPNPVHVYREPGRYKLTQFVRGCGFDSTFVFVTVKPKPTLELRLAQFSCLQADTEFDYRASDVSSTRWDFGDGNTSILNKPTHRYDTTGSYTVRLTVTDANQCQATAEQEVEVQPLPAFDLLAPDSLCVGEEANFEITNSANLNTINWQFGDTELAVGKIVEHAYARSGAYTITATVTDALGCKNTDTQPVFVRPTPTAAFAFEILNNCEPSEVAFTNQSKDANSYRWNFGNTGVSGLNNPNYTYDQAGTFTVQLLASYDNICFDSVVQKVTIDPIPRVDLKVEDLTCYRKNDGRIQVNADASYRVSVTGKDYFQQGNNLFEALRPGDYTIKVVAPTGCDTTYQVQIQEPDSLIVFIPQDTLRVTVGDTALIEVISNYSNLNYQWLPESEIFPQDSNFFYAVPQRSLWYEMLTSVGRCEVRDRVYIEVDAVRHVYIPNAFSPNGDTYNDFFYINGGDGVERIEQFIIFERRGGTVYERRDIPPNDPTVGWDGTLKGKKLNPQVFVYLAKIRFTDGKTEVFSGDVTLVR